VDVELGVVRQVLAADLRRDPAPGPGHDLHQATRPFVPARLRLELALDPDDAVDQVGRQVVLACCGVHEALHAAITIDLVARQLAQLAWRRRRLERRRRQRDALDRRRVFAAPLVRGVVRRLIDARR